MKKVVIDTNIIVSATLYPNSKPAEIMKQFYFGKIILYYSDSILSEYKRVLSYAKFDFPIEVQTDIINTIKEKGILLSTLQSTIPLPDETDRIFYDTAKASGAMLITGNLKHYPSEPFIMTPADLLSVAVEC